MGMPSSASKSFRISFSWPACSSADHPVRLSSSAHRAFGEYAEKRGEHTKMFDYGNASKRITPEMAGRSN